MIIISKDFSNDSNDAREDENKSHISAQWVHYSKFSEQKWSLRKSYTREAETENKSGCLWHAFTLRMVSYRSARYRRRDALFTFCFLPVHFLCFPRPFVQSPALLLNGPAEKFIWNFHHFHMQSSLSVTDPSSLLNNQLSSFHHPVKKMALSDRALKTHCGRVDLLWKPF